VSALLLALALQAAPAAAAVPGRCGEPDPCQLPARTDEISLVFLGDSGYGQGGASEWGSHAQSQVAERMAAVCPRPNLIFFLGDNVYWKGSPDLFGPRFDTMYAPLFDVEHQRVHSALGNHDVKGCRLSEQAAFGPRETCAEAFVRLVVEDVERDAGPNSPLLAGDVMERARRVGRGDCPPAFDQAYEQDTDSGTTCFATQALRHAPFGYGMRGGNPLRYYSIDHPAQASTADTRLRVLVTDSNTLRRGPGPSPGTGDEKVLEPAEAEPYTPARWDQLQALWVENQLRTTPAGAWRIAVMHHPPWSPRGCAFKLLGKCAGGHPSDEATRRALTDAYVRRDAAQGVDVHAEHRPDLVIGSHNHFYSRSRPLDATGYPTTVPGQGVRYYVTGGGGAPLYRLLPLHSRYAAAGSYHHFLYMRLRGDQAFHWTIDVKGTVRDGGCFVRGESVDRCIKTGTPESAELVCGEPAPTSGCGK
jgi:hypothetical protein